MTIRPKLYRLPGPYLAREVLVPAFRTATSVKGAFGWFTAGWIEQLAHGLATYLRRSDVEPIRFTISPDLFPPEYDALTTLVERRAHVLEAIEAILVAGSSPGVSALQRHSLDCLTWMVANERLVLKVAVPIRGVTYHPKIWVFDDGVNQIAIRGSANATSAALGGNIEHMDVDCSWIDGSANKVHDAVEMVDAWSKGEDSSIEEVCDLPAALEGAIRRLSPAARPSPKQYTDLMTGADTKTGPVFEIPADIEWKSGRYSHQGEAVDAWERHDRRGVIAMATGAGKTIAALIGARRLQDDLTGPLLIVISVPSTPLLNQWRAECKKFGLRAGTPTLGSKEQKKHAIASLLMRLRSGSSVEAIVVTNALISDASFQKSVAHARSQQHDLRILHIGDEAHGLGAPQFIASPPTFIDFRLGLSATPVRQYDDDGTRQLFEYFGPTVFEFGLDKAIGFCLVPYDYFPSVVELIDSELDEFRALSADLGQLVARMGGKLDFSSPAVAALVMKRRAIVETAEAKIPELRRILSGQENLRHTLVYCSSKNPDQLEQAMATVAALGIVAARVTEDETATGRADQIIDRFEAGDFQLLVAKRVLDEGVDIPQTRQAVLLSSSTVEREWVQRRGRILRMFPGKTHATIHDVLALPPPGSLDQAALRFISSELDRVRAFAEYARNSSVAVSMIDNIHALYFTGM